MTAADAGQPRDVACECCQAAPASCVVRLPDAEGVATFLVCGLCAQIADNAGLSR